MHLPSPRRAQAAARKPARSGRRPRARSEHGAEPDVGGRHEARSGRRPRAPQGWGINRGIEDEPNDWNGIQSAANGQRNLVAAALGWGRAISGEVCSNDDDFFVINERVRTGDEIFFTTDPPELSVDVRFYLGNPCDYDEPPVGDPANEKKGCALQNQVFPETDSKGFTAESSTARTGTFTVPAPTGACGPSGCPNYRLLYMGIRLKDGPCHANYTLSAQITRAPGNEIY